MNYAGFWKRLRACLVDSVIMTIVSIVVMYIFFFNSTNDVVVVSSTNDIASTISAHSINIILIILGWIYYAGMESSSLQGTLGKMAAGIKVTDIKGNRIGFGRATGRHFGKFISMLILLIGFLMIPFTKKKQGLHDMMAGCLVVKK